MSDLRVVFSGAQGRMGRALVPGLRETAGIDLVAEVEKDDDLTAVVRAGRADVVVDFTEPGAARSNALAIVAAGAHGVIGTTGFRKSDLEAIDAAAREADVGVLVAPNFALGMLLLQRFAVDAVRHFPDVEIVEAHHPGKLDAPSGTAEHTAMQLSAAGAHAGKGEQPSRGLDVGGVRVHSIRLPGVVARQEVHFGGAGERLLLVHDAVGRECFLPGVVEGIRRIPSERGLVHGLDRLLWPEDRSA